MDTMNEIDVKIGEYINKNTQILPEYVLLDTKTYQEFAQSFFPREREVDGVKQTEVPRLKALVTHNAPWGIKILEVNTPDTLIEVVG